MARRNSIPSGWNGPRAILGAAALSAALALALSGCGATGPRAGGAQPATPGSTPITTPPGAASPVATAPATPRGADLPQIGLTPSPARTYRTVLTWNDVRSVRLRTGAHGRPEVSVRFTEQGTRELAAYTRTSVGKTLAVVLDKRVLASPVVEAPITGGEAVVQGLTSAQALDLAIIGPTGPLPFNLIPSRNEALQSVGWVFEFRAAGSPSAVRLERARQLLRTRLERLRVTDATVEITSGDAIRVTLRSWRSLPTIRRVLYRRGVLELVDAGRTPLAPGEWIRTRAG